MHTPQSRSTEKEMALRTSQIMGIVLISCLALAYTAFMDTPGALAKQTKAQCRECCEKMGYDDYYKDQCKLKCFRDPEHCKGAKPQPKPVAKPEPKPKPEPVAKKRRPRPRGSQSGGKIVFKWPNPLTLTPGRERDAAAQILAVNGMPPNHPNYMLALRSIEGVLKNFARLNPQGGKLPTDQLVEILLKYR